MNQRADIVVVGAGAAGLMAAIFTARTARHAGSRLRIIALDAARMLGAKILVAGGGRCNVSHHAVTEAAFAGSSRKAIGTVLRQFDVAATVSLFRELGVSLKREPTGKLFPTTDKARTVLNALLYEARRLGVELRHPARVASIRREGHGFGIGFAPPDVVQVASRIPQRHADNARPAEKGDGSLFSAVVVLATGGRSLPKTGSDGFGYKLAKSLGHTITERVFPALVPLRLPADHWICSLSGITLDATIELRSGTGKRLTTFTDSTLLTHFGLSGPSVLDISRYWIDAHLDDPDAQLVVNWLPGESLGSIDALLMDKNIASVAKRLSTRLPVRLARMLCEAAQVDPAQPSHGLKRDDRRRLARLLVETPLPIVGDRGFSHAEVTAGGIPLSEIELNSMHSRRCPGLFICGEICDVDGRIGGFNFQWAWSSGFVAGTAAARHAMFAAPRQAERGVTDQESSKIAEC